MPQTDLAPPGFELRIGILDAIRGGLLAFISLVVPPNPASTCSMFTSATQQYLTENPLIAVILAVIDHDGLSRDKIRQVLLGLRAKCLSSFRGIDALQPDFVLDLAGVDDHDTIAVCNTHDSPCQCISLCQVEAGAVSVD